MTNSQKMADRIFDSVTSDSRLSIEEIGAELDGSPIFSVIDLDTTDHCHLTLTKIN